MPDVPPGELRDIFFAWFFATVTNLDQIRAGKMTADQFTKMLEQNNFIKPGDINNRHAIEDIFQAITNNGDAYSTVAGDLKGIRPLQAPWGGPAPHPGGGELMSVFVPLQKQS